MHEGLATCPTERERESEKEMSTQREKGRAAIVAVLGQFMQSAKRGSAQNKSISRIFIISIKQFLLSKKYIRKAKKLSFSFCRRGNMHMTIAGNLCAAEWLQNMV